MKSKEISSKRKATIWSWQFQLPLGIVCIIGWAHSRFVDNRHEDWVLALGIPALIAAGYDIYLRSKIRK